jgi:hypothetical protein
MEIALSNGKTLVGYPAVSGLNGDDMAWGVGEGAPYTGYATALTSAGVDSSTTVTGVQIVADGDQAAGTTDDITGVQYDGQAIGGGTVSFAAGTTQHATEDAPFTQLKDPATTTASDQALTYTAHGLPAGMQDVNGDISGMPTASGQFSVSVTAKDVYGDVGHQSFVFDVATGNTVTLPPEGTQTATDGKSFDLTDTATTAPAGATVTYGETGLPAGGDLSINAATGEISGTPTAADNGQYAVTLSAAAAGAKTARQAFILNVVAAPAAPVYTAVGGTNGKVENLGSDKYLNVASNSYAPGNSLIQWNASGASHETFQYVTIDKNGKAAGGYLQAESPAGDWYYVTASGKSQLTLGTKVVHPASAVLGAALTSGEDATLDGAGITFPNDGGYVADDSGQSTANGAHVIAFPKNGGKNQQWKLP